MANIGDKFVIEIEDVLTSSVDPAMHRYRIKGFASLVFDDYGLGKLTPYTEPVEESEPEPPTFTKGDEVEYKSVGGHEGKGLYIGDAMDDRHYVFAYNVEYPVIATGDCLKPTGKHFDFGGGAWN